MRRVINLTVITLVLIGTGCTTTEPTSTDPGLAAQNETTVAPGTTDDVPDSVAGDRPAPEFPEGLDWLNTDAPLSMADLTGKVVLLDFWTYGCINCIHIIPDLERLEEEFAEELVVIGVHSAKFVNERATENIRQIVLRYGIEHPVVNDEDFAVWSAWGASAWPTVVLVDPAGNLVGGHAGEGVYEVVQPVIAALVAEFDTRGEIDRTPLAHSLESAGLPRTLLSYPGKVLADPQVDRLFIADTGNHRIIEVIRSTGEVTTAYGSGRRGFEDGDAAGARFDSPQGMALSPDGAFLYVADTNNHAIRTIDLATGTVATALGTGSQARTYPPRPGAVPGVELTSPWDLTEREGLLYIAMAGSHQIWVFDPASGMAADVVGSGGESTRNGPAHTAELAQPSGLVFDDGDLLFFADSESSSIRFADLGSAEHTTATLAGGDRSLFDFGDEDGFGTEARLQHPLGIEWNPVTGTLLVADTYNSKIKEIDPDDGRVTTRFGGEQGWADGTDARFFEPGGLSLIDSTLYVADTNNHAIRVIDLDTDVTTTMILAGIERFAPPAEDEDFAGVVIDIPDVATGTGPGSFVLDITLPPEHKVNEDAPSSVVWSVTGSAVSLNPTADRSLTGVTFPIEVPATFGRGDASITADVTVIYCRDDAESLCFIEQIRFHVAVTGGDAAVSPRISLPHTIELPNL